MPREVVPREHELDRPARQRIVERGDRARQRLGAHSLREQVLREPADVVAGALQLVDGVGAVQLLVDLAHRDALQREEVALVDHAA